MLYRRGLVASKAGRRLVVARGSATMAPSAGVKQKYDTAAAKLKEVSVLEGITGLLSWDEMVMMPEGASNIRGAQKEALTGVIYDKKTNPELGQLLKELASGGSAELGPYERATVRDAHKSFARSAAISKELAQRMARLETEGYTAWVEARKASDFSKFAPVLQQWVDANLEKAKSIDPSGANAYDTLLYDYEKGMTSARLDEIFSQVRAGLVPLIAEIKAKEANNQSAGVLSGQTFDVETQAKLCKQVAMDIGFSLEHGRLDVSVHPFTGGSHPTDVRMTTRFKPDDILEGLTGAVHETGHALYEQGRNQEHDGLPVSSAHSMGVHESQSLLWERMVALSKPFTAYLLPKLKEFFPAQFGAITAQQLYEACNVVKCGSIRVESDEVTYPMHIILRYEIERGLLDGSIKVADVPKVWNQKMQSYLGVTPSSDAQGCLQDIHWSGGAFAYFPTYSLGAMYACQLYAKAKEEIPGLEQQITDGSFGALKAWLNAKVHKVGSLHASADELLVAVTGLPLDPRFFLEYLRAKYTELYKL